MVPGLFGGAPNPFAAFLNRPQQPPMQMPGAPRPGVPQMPQGMPMQMPYQVGNPMAMPFQGMPRPSPLTRQDIDPGMGRKLGFRAGDMQQAFYGRSPFEQFMRGQIPGVPKNAQLPAGFRNTWENPFFALQQNPTGGGSGDGPTAAQPKPYGPGNNPPKGDPLWRNPNRPWVNPKYVWNGQRYVKPSWEHGG